MKAFRRCKIGDRCLLVGVAGRGQVVERREDGEVDDGESSGGSWGWNGWMDGRFVMGPRGSGGGEESGFDRLDHLPSV